MYSRAPKDDAIEQVLTALAEERSPDRSFCPSEAARRLAADWRPLMPRIRDVASRMGLLATQRGLAVDLRSAKGPVRLRKP
ncbi:MAG: DUF3253 domain-containing protein [Pseudomonadota bacterium]